MATKARALETGRSFRGGQQGLLQRVLRVLDGAEHPVAVHLPRYWWVSSPNVALCSVCARVTRSVVTVHILRFLPWRRDGLAQITR